jgi:hypothetical protein
MNIVVWVYTQTTIFILFYRLEYNTINLVLGADGLMEYINDLNIEESVDEGNSSNLETKKTLRILTQNLIDDLKNDKEVSQYKVNTYANIISKNLLPSWSNWIHKVKITLDKHSTHLFEFIPPKISQDFISRFINGKETMNGLLHRSPEIKMNISPKLFKTIQNPDDAYNFFKSAIIYYDSKIDKFANRIMTEVMRLNTDIKYLISNTKLSGVVIYPLSILFTFDKVDMSNTNSFEVTNEDIDTVNKFIRSIIINYASPEKEKKKIIEDVKEMVRTLKEFCEMNDNIKYLSYLPESVEKYYNNDYDEFINEARELFIDEQVDKTAPENKQLLYIREFFGVKKLKKIPSDLLAYIQIETEAIENSNDKMLIASYTLSKIEIVEWYIELLTVGSKKYIVPHRKEYLENLRLQLLECYKNIMKVKITKVRDRPIIDIKYPKGYDG